MGYKKEVLAALFEKVGLDAVFFERFPSELSGGQLQRVVIALSGLLTETPFDG